MKPALQFTPKEAETTVISHLAEKLFARKFLQSPPPSLSLSLSLESNKL